MTGQHSGFFEGTEMPTAGWWEALWRDPADVLAKVGMKPNMAVMDLCSGDGWFTMQIAELARHVVAIDIDANLLNVARHRLAENHVANCDFVAGNASDLTQLWPSPVDFVFLANAFHACRIASGWLDRCTMRSDLRGLFAVVNWHQRPREETTILGEPRGPRTELRMTPAQTVQAVQAGGFKFVRVVEVPPYHYGAVFERSAT